MIHEDALRVTRAPVRYSRATGKEPGTGRACMATNQAALSQCSKLRGSAQADGSTMYGQAANVATAWWGAGSGEDAGTTPVHASGSG